MTTQVEPRGRLDAEPGAVPFSVQAQVGARVALALVVTITTAVVWLALSHTTYTATSSVYVKSGITDAAAVYERGLYEQNRVQTYAVLARSTLITAAAAQRAGVSISPEDLADEVSVQVLPLTVIVAITVEDESAAHARDLSIALAQTVADQGNQLEQEGSSGTSPVRLIVFDEAALPSDPAAPERTRIVLLCALFGTLLAIVTPLPRRRRRRPGPDPDAPRHLNGDRPA